MPRPRLLSVFKFAAAAASTGGSLGFESEARASESQSAATECHGRGTVIITDVSGGPPRSEPELSQSRPG